jgi:SAM-dependent methyltransferase
MSDAGDDRARWEARYADGGHTDGAPSEWVIQQCLALPASHVIVDVAAGQGRHARALARAGRTVVAIDLIERAVRTAVREPGVSGVVADTTALPLRAGSLDLILCTNYLDRHLFDVFKVLLRPGGSLVYETYTVEHVALVERGEARGPRDPAYLLGVGELRRLVAPLTIVAEREGLVRDGAGRRACASILARRSV